MPSNQSPLGALPARFRRERLLIIGCGDVGMRVAKRTNPSVRLLALTSSPQRCEPLRAQGITPLVGNLDVPKSLARLAGLATRVVHLAPPPNEGRQDPRTRRLLNVLRQRALPVSLVYGSTTGVYGNCHGAWVDETRPLQATTPRAQRRVDAEGRVRTLARAGLQARCRVSVLRIPGIYAADREGGTPRERLLRGTPVLDATDDVYTNHIHADDLARACLVALWRGRTRRVYNVADTSVMKMGDYMAQAAELYGLPKPQRMSRAEITQHVTPMTLSFMNESRRIATHRMQRELKLRLHYPEVWDGLRATKAK